MSETSGIIGKCSFLVASDRIKSAFITYNCFFFREEIRGKDLKIKKASNNHPFCPRQL